MTTNLWFLLNSGHTGDQVVKFALKSQQFKQKLLFSSFLFCVFFLNNTTTAVSMDALCFYLCPTTGTTLQKNKIHAKEKLILRGILAL